MLIEILETGEVRDTEFSYALRLVEHGKAIPQKAEPVAEEKPVKKARTKKAAAKSEDTAKAAEDVAAE